MESKRRKQIIEAVNRMKADLKKLGIEPHIHVFEDEVLILIDVVDIINMIKRRVQYPFVHFDLKDTFIVIRIPFVIKL